MPPVFSSLVVALFLRIALVLGRLLGCLLLLLILGLAGISRQWLLQNLENLLILDLLVRLDLAQVKRWRTTQFGDAILRDGCT